MKKHHPKLPSELVTQESVWHQLKTWLASTDREASVALVLGKTGIGKETLVHLTTRILNYKEKMIDSDKKEDLLSFLAAIKQVKRERDLHNRKTVVVLRDVDPNLLYKVAEAKNRFVPIIVLAEELSKKAVDSLGSVMVVRCYHDSVRTLARVEAICHSEDIEMPREIKLRVENGERIGKVLADLHLFSLSSRLKGCAQSTSAKLSLLEVVRRLLYTKGERKKTFVEIEDLCKSATFGVADLLFENYAEKCLSLEDLALLADKSSEYDTRTYHEENKTIPAYIYHQALCNDLTLSFKIPTPPVPNPNTARTRSLIYHGVPYQKQAILPYIENLITALSRAIKKAPTLAKVDLYTRRATKHLLQGTKASSAIDTDTREYLHSVEVPISTDRVVQPRYIHKEGHSYYATRDIPLKDILGSALGL
ncbi:hypothetical protein NEDG_00455 [Nematocida displodere]|uniref:Uncharacterized protein n=1 Tax=Nematocida displodere TaxID=1805483 RepID=A0A177EKT5_9MICR|nr:hypothetical protein NEDG_00455 [Nematocida displodere]